MAWTPSTAKLKLDSTFWTVFFLTLDTAQEKKQNATVSTSLGTHLNVVVVVPAGRARMDCPFSPFATQLREREFQKKNAWNVENSEDDRPRTRVLFFNWKMRVQIGNDFLFNEIKDYLFRTNYRPTPSRLIYEMGRPFPFFLIAILRKLWNWQFFIL